MKKELRWLSLAAAVISIIAGFYMFAQPMVSLASLAIFFSIVLLISGIFETVRYFTDKENRSGWILFNGIVTILLAIALLSGSFLEMVVIIPFVIGFWVLFGSISRVFISFNVRKQDKSEGNWMLIIGIIGIIVGIMMLSHPLFTGLVAAYMIGFSFIYQGIAGIYFFFKNK